MTHHRQTNRPNIEPTLPTPSHVSPDRLCCPGDLCRYSGRRSGLYATVSLPHYDIHGTLPGPPRLPKHTTTTTPPQQSKPLQKHNNKHHNRLAYQFPQYQFQRNDHKPEPFTHHNPADQPTSLPDRFSAGWFPPVSCRWDDSSHLYAVVHNKKRPHILISVLRYS